MHHDPLVDTWTFCSSMGIKRRIDFIASSRSLSLSSSSATNLLDLGSDHRAVLATFLIESEKEKIATWCGSTEKGLETDARFGWMSDFIS